MFEKPTNSEDAFKNDLLNLQLELVSTCLDYTEGHANEIFIYCSYEPKMYAFDVFYKINNDILHKHQLNLNGDICDVSRDAQQTLLKFGIQKLKEIHQLFIHHNRNMPSEMKLHYKCKNLSFVANYQYDLLYTNHETLLPDHLFDEWYSEEQSK